MTPTEITYIILFSLPAYVAMMCGSYLIRMLYLNEHPFGRKPFILTIVLYFAAMTVWLSQILYVVLPEVYVTLHSFLFFTCLLLSVLSFRFVFEITKVNPSDKFPHVHYLAPFTGFALMLLWSFFVPREVQLSLVRSGGVAVEGHEWFSLFFASDIPLLLGMNLFYAALGLRRTASYRKVVVDYSADEFRGAIQWIYHIIFTWFAICVGTGAIYIASKIIPVNAWLFAIPAIISIVKYILLVHNILFENFVVIKTDMLVSGESNRSPVDATYSELPESINDKSSFAIMRLEAYIRKEKPYLNPKFKITDMARDLNTNRTSLSSLINRTYGVNFCYFINRFRLQELKQLKTNPAIKNLSEEELVSMAGFSDYRGYLRVKFREEIGS